MNPFKLDATGLMIWGLVAHLIADWPLQNAWMATMKSRRRRRFRKGTTIGLPMDRWWDRHPAAYVHAGVHCVLLSLVFGWVAVPLALAHLVIDTRKPVEWWSRLIRQTQPRGGMVRWSPDPLRALQRRAEMEAKGIDTKGMEAWSPAYDIGTEVRVWTNQVFHVATIAVAALIVGAVS